MTNAAGHFGKFLPDFSRSVTTKQYIASLAGKFPDKDYLSALANTLKTGDKELVRIQKGNGLLPQVGTWAHPKLAVFFARWLDTDFAVWCAVVIDDIPRGNAEVVVAKPEQSEILKMPTTLLEAGKLWLGSRITVPQSSMRQIFTTGKKLFKLIT